MASLLTPLQTTSGRFSPTRLATTLTSSAPPLPTTGGSSIQSQGFIVLETNYRIYAYTGTPHFRSLARSKLNWDLDNPLQIAILNLFITLKSRFPNLIVGILTRESVKKALTNGITADQARSHTFHLTCQSLIPNVQIISYLTTHAHPQMRKNASPRWLLCIDSD